jgi:hypothetical protein
MDRKTKKEMQAEYKEREVIGGVYLVRNTLKNKSLLSVATDLRGSVNRFEFSEKTGSCVYPQLQNDWAEQGGSGFVFETLEELKKGDAQTASEFKADLELLKEMWLEKLSDEELY